MSFDTRLLNGLNVLAAIVEAGNFVRAAGRSFGHLLAAVRELRVVGFGAFKGAEP